MSRADQKPEFSDGLRTSLLARDRERRSNRTALVQAASKSAPRRNDLLPNLELEQRDPGSLNAPMRNVRALKPAHIHEVASAIQALGFSAPVLIDKAGQVIDGLIRIEAAKLLGLTPIPCIVVDHLTVEERRLLRLATNRLGEKGAWDLDELKLEFEELIVLDAPIEVSGFELTEIDGVLAGQDQASVEVRPVAPNANARPVARLGDTFLLGRHRVTCGNSCERAVVARAMAGEFTRFVFTDEPYNVAIAGHVTRGRHREFAMASGEMSAAEFDAFNANWIAAALPHLIDGGLLATFIDWRGLHSVTKAALDAQLSQLNLMVWAKTNAGMGSLYRSQHEVVPLFKKGEAAHVNNIALGRKGRHRTNVWSYPGASTLGSDARKGLEHHPTVKPTAMLVDALYDLTNRGDVVLDPFLGSGSTLMAAETSGRVCYGVELDPLYVDVIVRRYQNLTKSDATLELTGESFATLEKMRATEGS